MFQGKTTSRLIMFRILLKGLGFIITVLRVRLSVVFGRKESHEINNIKSIKAYAIL